MHFIMQTTTVFLLLRHSYPNFLGPDRALQNFNLDVYYNACEEANLRCKHVYIYRDPYSVLKSTSKNRHFNSNIYDSIRLYTSVLQMIHSQLMSHPDRTLGCFGFLDYKGALLEQDWDRFGKLWGWEDDGAFASVASEVNTKNPTEMSDKEKSQLVPDRLGPLMKAFEDIHNRVNDLCYSTLYDREMALDELAPAEDISAGYVAPNVVVPDEVA